MTGRQKYPQTQNSSKRNPDTSCTSLLKKIYILLICISVNKGQISPKPPSILNSATLIETRNELFQRNDNETLIKLHCSASGDAPLSYIWKKDGRHVGSKETLHIDLQAGKDSSGQYQCFVSNKWGMATSWGQFINEIPKTTRQEFLLPAANLWANITCDNIQSGYPFDKTSVKWIRGKNVCLQYIYSQDADFMFGDVLDNDPRHIVGPDGTLYILHFQMNEEDLGAQYCCLVPLEHRKFRYQTMYNTQTDATIFHTLEADHRDFLPFFVFNSSEVTVALEGYETSLWCITAGKPIPKISWEIVKSASTVFKNSNMTFIIQNVTKEHAGLYRCVVNNGRGTDLVREFKLDVKSRPHFIKKPIEQHRATIGSKFQLECEGSGDPKPSVRWTFNGDDPKISKLQISRDGRTISTPNFSRLQIGIYGCNISNTYGFNYTEVSVLSKDAFNEIEMVLTPTVKCNDTQISLSWDKPLNETVVTFVIEEASNSNLISSKHLLPGSFSELVFSAKPNTVHSFSIWAITGRGTSSPTAFTEPCIIPPAIPEINPRLQSASFSNPSLLEVTWEQVNAEDFYGYDFEYIVQWTKAENDDFKYKDWNEANFPHTSSYAWIHPGRLVENFDPGEYLVRVISKNEKGLCKNFPQPLRVVLPANVPIARVGVIMLTIILMIVIIFAFVFAVHILWKKMKKLDENRNFYRRVSQRTVAANPISAPELANKVQSGEYEQPIQLHQLPLRNNADRNASAMQIHNGDADVYQAYAERISHIYEEINCPPTSEEHEYDRLNSGRLWNPR